MRLSTLILASALAWVFTAGVAVADSHESTAAEFDVFEEVASEERPVADEDPGADTLAAPEATVAPEASEAAEAAPVAENAAASWDDFEDPGFDPTEPVYPEPQTVASQPAAWSSSIPLGPMAVDGNGVNGRIHTVAPGDTLWDISEAYLGTPWVWPSVWHENDDIENPHVIEPGDRIWITSNEMRRVTDGEAEEMLSAMPVADAETEVAAEIEYLPEEGSMLEFEGDETLVAGAPLLASVEDESELPLAMPIDPAAAMTGEIISLPYEQTAHFASVDTIEEASQIVDSPTLRAFLTQGDEVYVALGEGEVSRGDEFTIFRNIEKIRDLETGAVLGYHFDERGWLEITSVEGESSIGIIKGARADMQRGDRLVTRVAKLQDIPVRRAMDEVEARIVFMPGNRWLMGTTDSVYLNVGSIHGIEIGTRMEVYHAGLVQDSNKMPDTVVAEMVVVSIDSESCVAFVTETVRELEIGDHVRTVMNDQFAVR